MAKLNRLMKTLAAVQGQKPSMSFFFKGQRTRNGTFVTFLLFIITQSCGITSVRFTIYSIYAEVVHAKNEFNHILTGETGPEYGFKRDPKLLADFIKTIYDEAKVSPQDVEYVEAFGSGKIYICGHLLYQSVIQGITFVVLMQCCVNNCIHINLISI